MKKERPTRFVCQGDVPLTRINALPEGLKKVAPQGDRFILREGEATGHKHSVPVKDATLFIDEKGQMFYKVDSPMEVEHDSITHQEHKPVVLDPGVYKVGHVKEYDPHAEESRRLRD